MSSNPQRVVRQGGTLIEVAIGVLVLAILALGASMLYYQSWGSISVQRNRRAALVVASSRLEAMRAASYADIAPPTEDFNTYYVSASGSGWSVADSDPGEEVTINRFDYPILTTVAYTDADPSDGVSSYDYLTVRVSVGYRQADASDRVVLETRVAP